MKSIMKILFLNLLFATSLIAQDDEFGIASYYSDLFQGKPTASGELYDNTMMTAAHKTLPFGTLITVTRIDNNKSVQVRVNDRGPFISGRVVEVSKEAAKRLDLISDGSARVKVTVVKAQTTPAPPNDAVASEAKPKSYDEAQPKVEPTPKKEAPADQPKPAPKANKEAEQPKVNTAPSNGAVTPKGIEAPATAQSVLVRGSEQYVPFDLYEVQLKRPEKKGFGVQVAALSTQDALFRKIADLQGEWFENILISVEKNKKGEVTYKVILGSFATHGEAQVYKTNLKKNKKMDGFVVDLSTLNKS